MAPGGPGPGPSWGPGRKQGFGAAAGPDTQVWFTIARGNLSEVFYPRLDRPCLRELRFIASGRGTAPVDDAFEAEHVVRWVEPGVPAFRVTSTHSEYRLVKEFCCDPEVDALLISGEFVSELPDVALYVQASPHLVPGSDGNEAVVLDRDPPLLAMRQGETWIVVVGPFDRGLAGFVNSSDILVELDDNDGELQGAWDTAKGGNVAAGARLGGRQGAFQIAVGFGSSRTEAEDLARRALRRGAGRAREETARAWRFLHDLPPNLEKVAGDGGALARASMTVLRCLEDKTERGAWVAAPAAPWGEQVSDGDQVYNLVWPRDLCHCVTGLMDAGDHEPALRALAYLERMQKPDGSWHQNFRLDGSPHWDAEELDEVAAPILLAWRLGVADVLDHDPWPAFVRRAARYLVTHGPATGLDRWEDAGGLSPSTIAVSVAALCAASAMAGEAGEQLAGRHLLDVADYWNERLEAWCYMRQFRHFVRLNPDPDARPPADAAVGVEFTELVRRGLRAPRHPSIEHSVTTSDALLRAELPGGPSWRRYVGDRYGETAEGLPWRREGGIGRPWPLLTAERGQLAHAAGEPVAPYLRALEAFAGPELLLPEQVWDEEDRPERELFHGQATGSVRPLGWAHAEYLKLLAAVATAGRPDVVDPARRRYADAAPAQPPLIWHERHDFRTFPNGRVVKVQLEQPGIVRWTGDGWATHRDAELREVGLELYAAELPTGIMRPGATIEWTACHPDGWTGTNQTLTCVEPDA